MGGNEQKATAWRGKLQAVKFPSRTEVEKMSHRRFLCTAFRPGMQRRHRLGDPGGGVVVDAVQLALPGIAYAPAKVRRYGLQEAHTHPLVSSGKDAAGVWHSSFRVPAARAWGFPELEYGRTGTSIPALLFDMDGDPTDWLVDVLGPALPRPNWITWRTANRHAHVCYTLARPVLTGAQARPTPQAWLARIGEYLALKLKADAAYSAALAHNPMARASRGRYRTDWLRQEPYSLAELAAFVPKGWRRPPQPRTVYGRNDALFREGMRWSGKPANWGKWAALGTHLWAMNAGFIEPLNARELAGIVKSIVRYQRRNLESGQQQEMFSRIQSVRGKKSGAARYQGSNEQTRPWEAEGVSRRTWYRHQAGQHTGKRGRPKK